MAREIGSVCKLCRREGEKLYLKGARCESAKCAIVKRNYQPGQHSWSRGRPSNFGVRLREKQKLKRFFGVTERSFRLIFERAARLPGNTGEHMLIALQQRLGAGPPRRRHHLLEAREGDEAPEGVPGGAARRGRPELAAVRRELV